MTTNTPSSSMRAVAIGALVLAAIVLSACNGGQAWVASIDGTKLSAERFAEGVALFQEISSGASDVEEEAPTVIPTASASGYVQWLIQAEAMRRLAADQGVTPTAADVDTAHAALLEQATALGIDFADMPDWFRNQVAENQATGEALIAKFGEGVDQTAQAREVYEQSKAFYTQYCFDLLATSDAEDATAAYQRIDAGEPFNDVAPDYQPDDAQVPAGTENPFEVCQDLNSLSRYFSTDLLTALSEAADDALLDVAEEQGAYYVIQRRRAQEPTYEELEATILQQLGNPGEAEFSQALNETFASLSIEINPKYGTWSPETGYVAPEGAERPAPAATDGLILGSTAG